MSCSRREHAGLLPSMKTLRRHEPRVSVILYHQLKHDGRPPSAATLFFTDSFSISTSSQCASSVSNYKVVIMLDTQYCVQPRDRFLVAGKSQRLSIKAGTMILHCYIYSILGMKVHLIGQID